MPKGIYTSITKRGRKSSLTQEEKQERDDRRREHAKDYEKKKLTKSCITCGDFFTSRTYNICKSCRKDEKIAQTIVQEVVPKNYKEKENIKADNTKSKIYKIVSPTSNRIYIGSTARPLHIRFMQHKYAYEKWKKDPSGKFCSSKYVFETSDECYIEIIEELNCENRWKLYQREAEIVVMNLEHVVNKCLTWTKGVGNSNPVFNTKV